MITRLRVWWWKWRYTERILKIGFGNERTESALRGAKQVTEAGWETQLEWSDGNVQDALNHSPIDCADEELSYWTE